MTHKEVKIWEQELIFLLNLDGWQLKPSEDKYCFYDAYGTNPKGQSCILEFKFRQDYYKTKILECEKWNNLTKYKVDEIYYVVIDSKGCHIYTADAIDHQKVITLELPKKTIAEIIEKKTKACYELIKPPAYFYKYHFF